MRLQRVFGLVMAVLAALFAAAPANAGAYKNFRAAIYITVHDTKRLADPATFNRDFARVSSQLQFDKVYIEAYRDRVFATDAELGAGQARVPGERYPDLRRDHARGRRVGRPVRHLRLRESPPTAPNANARCG